MASDMLVNEEEVQVLALAIKALSIISEPRFLNYYKSSYIIPNQM